MSYSLFRLYQVTEELNLLSEEGEVLPDADIIVRDLLIKRDEMREDIVKDYLNMDAFITAIEVEENKFKVKRQRMEKLKDAIEKGLLQFLDGEKIQIGLHKVSVRKSEAIEFDGDDEDLGLLKATHPDLIKVKVSYTLDKVATKKHIKETGELPNGVRLVTNKSLNVR